MSPRELSPLEVMQRLAEKRLSQKSAADPWIESVEGETTFP